MTPTTAHLQLRLIQLADIDEYRFVDPLQGWPLLDVRALALDPDVEVRRLAALSNLNWDIELQRVVATDPDEDVVMNLLARIDPPKEIVRLILDGPHTRARRELAQRNLTSETLMLLIDDHDHEVRTSARATLERRGVVLASMVGAA